MGIQKTIQIGDIITSVSGRDKDRYYIVVKAEEKFVWICNGKLHKTDKPKKKNVKHIMLIKSANEAVTDRLRKGDLVTNKEIRKAISESLKQTETE